MLHSCQLAREPYLAVREIKFVTSLFLTSILVSLYIHVSLPPWGTVMLPPTHECDCTQRSAYTKQGACVSQVRSHRCSGTFC